MGIDIKDDFFEDFFFLTKRMVTAIELKRIRGIKKISWGKGFKNKIVNGKSFLEPDKMRIEVKENIFTYVK